MNCSLAAVSYEKHSSPSDDHSDINHRWNWKLGIGIYWDDFWGLCWSLAPWDSVLRGEYQGSIMDDGDEGVLQVRQTRSVQVSFFS